MLDELDEALEFFDEHLDLTETSGNAFFEIFTLNFGVSKNWSKALFCDLTKVALSIFSRNNLQKLNVSCARLLLALSLTVYL